MPILKEQCLETVTIQILMSQVALKLSTRARKQIKVFRLQQWGPALASMHQDRQVFIQELTYK